MFKNVTFTVKTLTSLGFIINEEKSKLIPSKLCTFLGLNFDSSLMCIKLPEEKQTHILKLISKNRKM